MRANEDGLPWTNPWAAVVAALDTCAPAEGAPAAPKTSLRAALTEAVDTIVTGIDRSTRPGRDGFLLTSHLQQLLDKHPADVPVISRERLAGAILAEWMRHVQAQTRAAPIDHCLAYADAVIESGMFRSVAEVQAGALRAAAADLYGDNGPDHPLSTATWLRERADALHPVHEGSEKA